MELPEDMLVLVFTHLVNQLTTFPDIAKESSRNQSPGHALPMDVDSALDLYEPHQFLFLNNHRTMHNNRN